MTFFKGMFWVLLNSIISIWLIRVSLIALVFFVFCVCALVVLEVSSFLGIYLLFLEKEVVLNMAIATLIGGSFSAVISFALDPEIFEVLFS